MSIVGCSVIHTTWGYGTIENFSSGIITVRFDNTSQGEKIIRFQFPNAFTQGFLVGSDAISTKTIWQVMAERKCSICGRDDISTEPIDGNSYCPSCKKQHTVLCSFCGEHHSKSSMFYIQNQDYPYSRTPICPSCASSKTFICDRCEERHFITHRASVRFNNQNLCISCFSRIAKTCHFCNSVFDLDKGVSIYRNSGNVHVCPACIDVETFICSECGCRELKSDLIDSKYVPADHKVCSSCVRSCAVCNTPIDAAHTTESFGKRYCPDCWSTLKLECPYCGDEFVPEVPSQQICPDCVEMESYISRLEGVSHLSLPHKNISYGCLEYIDRCELFTDLYRYCGSLA